MAEKKHPAAKEKNHIDKDDVFRAEKGTNRDAPVKANEKDTYVPDTELTNPPNEVKESAAENDPTSGHSPTH